MPVARNAPEGAPERFRRSENLAAGRIHSARGRKRGPRPAEPGGVTGRSEGGDRSNTSCRTPFRDNGKASCLSPETRRKARPSVFAGAKTSPQGGFTPPEGEKRGPRPAEPGGVTGRSEGGDRSNTSYKTPFQDNKTASCLSPEARHKARPRGFAGAKTSPQGGFTPPEEAKGGPRPALPGGATGRSVGENGGNTLCRICF